MKFFETGVVNIVKTLTPLIARVVVALSAEHPAPDWRAQVRGLPVETPPCTLMTPGAMKIHLGFSVLKVPIRIILLGVPKRESHPLQSGSKL